MEKHNCKSCFKSLPNGRSLGSHMKFNMLNLSIPPNVEEEESEVPPSQLSQESQSESASYSSSDGDEKGQFYEFVDAADSVVLQARESETDSSKNPTRRRSKRTWKTLERHEEETKKLKVNTNQPSHTESVSSISDTTTTTEEDIAFCLMMLSRDQWKSRVHQDDDIEEEEEEETDESEECFKSSKVNTTTTTRSKYRCETCKKVFNSHQALGGHRASHKKIKGAFETENVGNCSITTEKKTRHECSVCFRVFSSGQALGGHKRSHVTSQVATTLTQNPVKSPRKVVVNLIDLNLPAPMDGDDDDDDDGSLMLK